GADVLRLVRERPFGTVRIDARTDVKGARVQRPRDVRILAMVFGQVFEKVDAGDRGGDFGRMDIAVDPERGLFARRPARAIGDGGKPDVPAFETAADRLDGNELRKFGGKGLEQIGELGVAIEAVETDARHGGSVAGKARSVAAPCGCRQRCAARKRVVLRRFARTSVRRSAAKSVWRPGAASANL